MPEWQNSGGSGDQNVRVNLDVNVTGNAKQELQATAGEVRKLIGQMGNLQRQERQTAEQATAAARAQVDGLRQLQQARQRVLSGRDVPPQYVNQARTGGSGSAYGSWGGALPGAVLTAGMTAAMMRGAGAGRAAGGAPSVVQMKAPDRFPTLKVDVPPPLRVQTPGPIKVVVEYRAVPAATTQAARPGMPSLPSLARSPLPAGPLAQPAASPPFGRLSQPSPNAPAMRSYATGGPVRQTGPAYLHRGEYVVPRHLAIGSDIPGEGDNLWLTGGYDALAGHHAGDRRKLGGGPSYSQVVPGHSMAFTVAGKVTEVHNLVDPFIKGGGRAFFSPAMSVGDRAAIMSGLRGNEYIGREVATRLGKSPEMYRGTFKAKAELAQDMWAELEKKGISEEEKWQLIKPFVDPQVLAYMNEKKGRTMTAFNVNEIKHYKDTGHVKHPDSGHKLYEHSAAGEYLHDLTEPMQVIGMFGDAAKRAGMKVHHYMTPVSRMTGLRGIRFEKGDAMWKRLGLAHGGRIPAQHLAGGKKVKARFSIDEKEIGKTLEQLVGGRDPEHWDELAGLVGAPDNAEVEAMDPGNGKGVLVYVRHPVYRAKRFLGKDSAKKKYIENKEFWMDEAAQGGGLGTHVFASAVANARKHGFAYMKAHAAKVNPGDPDKPHAGYYTWPRMGYDQAVRDLDWDDPDEAAVRGRALVAYPHAKSILDIMETEQGRKWWKTHGADLMHARFDLSEGSRSLSVLRGYLQEPAVLEKLKKSGLVPHLAGGGNVNWSKRGTDTVPAWLPGGAFVVNAGASAAHRSLLDHLGAGTVPGSARQPVDFAHGSTPAMLTPGERVVPAGAAPRGVLERVNAAHLSEGGGWLQPNAYAMADMMHQQHLANLGSGAPTQKTIPVIIMGPKPLLVRMDAVPGEKGGGKGGKDKEGEGEDGWMDRLKGKWGQMAVGIGAVSATLMQTLGQVHAMQEGMEKSQDIRKTHFERQQALDESLPWGEGALHAAEYKRKFLAQEGPKRIQTAQANQAYNIAEAHGKAGIAMERLPLLQESRALKERAELQGLIAKKYGSPTGASMPTADFFKEGWLHEHQERLMPHQREQAQADVEKNVAALTHGMAKRQVGDVQARMGKLKATEAGLRANVQKGQTSGTIKGTIEYKTEQAKLITNLEQQKALYDELKQAQQQEMQTGVQSAEAQSRARQANLGILREELNLAKQQATRGKNIGLSSAYMNPAQMAQAQIGQKMLKGGAPAWLLGPELQGAVRQAGGDRYMDAKALQGLEGAGGKQYRQLQGEFGEKTMAEHAKSVLELQNKMELNIHLDAKETAEEKAKAMSKEQVDELIKAATDKLEAEMRRQFTELFGGAK